MRFVRSVRSWRLASLILAAALVAVATLGPAGVAAQQGGDDAERLRELVARLLGRGGLTPDGRPIETQILLGELPSAAPAPAPLPVPPGARVVGSVVQRAGGEVVIVTVALDAPGAADATASFYEREFSDRGFRSLPTGPTAQGGFQPTGQSSFRTFCGTPSGPYVNVQLTTPSEGPTHVRLTVDALVDGPCVFPSVFGPGPGGPALPVLTAPRDVTLQLTGPFVFGGPPMVGNRIASDATAVTDLAVGALEAAFAAQLTTAGWTRIAGEADDVLAWSRWQVPGEEGRAGFLYVLTGPGPRERTLHLDAATTTRR